MILLTGTADLVQIVTSAACTIDVHASWVDNSASAVTPGRTNTAITTATTTTVVGSPISGVQRNLKTLNARNKHASASCDVTVRHTDGTTAVELHKVTLPAGSALEYVDGAGFAVVPSGTTVNTFQRFLTSGSFTYTRSANCRAVKIKLVGGGGGTGAGNTNGGDTTIAALSLTAGGGAGASGGGLPGAGGTASGGNILNVSGQNGTWQSYLGAGIGYPGGNDGSGPFGSGGRGAAASGSGVTSGTGNGAGAGGIGHPTDVNTASGGAGAGGYVEHWVISPAASYALVIGIGGGGVAQGSPGGIVFEEFF